MKIRILIISFLGLAQSLNAQCTADAGANMHRCSPDSIVKLGGSPTASGGSPPYTYEWSIDPIPFIPPTIPFLYASDILDDTTIANPNASYDQDTLAFYLKITDSLGCVAHDTIVLTTSYFGIHHAFDVHMIHKGDSVYLYGMSNVYSANAASYSWSPGHGLSDSTLSDPFWAKPHYDIAYTATVTDSMGCSISGPGPAYYVFVSPVGLEESQASSGLSIFPNPTTDFFYIEKEEGMEIQQVNLYDLNGQSMSMNNIDNRYELGSVSPGVYILEVLANDGLTRLRIMKQ